jgi:methylated-DNA-[protein]-cysteine S-methyltransferase
MATPIGELTVVAEDGAIAAISMQLPARRAGQGPHVQDRREPGTRDQDPRHDQPPAGHDLGDRDDAGLAEAVRQLEEYFAGERTEFTLPLAPVGDAFRQRVWALLREIPYGQTRSYGQLARVLGDVNLSQAVGRANGRNPISIIVPCHRVIGADGSLVGYAGGLDRKRFLLSLEEPPAEEAHRLF